MSIKEQNFAVPAASGGRYFNKTLLTVELSTCAASLTFIMKCVVSLICLYIILEVYEVYILDLHKICQQYGSIVKTYRRSTGSM